MSKPMTEMTPLEQMAAWSSYHKLDQEPWILYTCTDCDPENLLDDADDEDPANKYDIAAQIVLPQRIDKPNHCPRCGSYLSMMASATVTVTWATNDTKGRD